MLTSARRPARDPILSGTSIDDSFSIATSSHSHGLPTDSISIQPSSVGRGGDLFDRSLESFDTGNVRYRLGHALLARGRDQSRRTTSELVPIYGLWSSARVESRTCYEDGDVRRAGSRMDAEHQWKLARSVSRSSGPNETPCGRDTCVLRPAPSARRVRPPLAGGFNGDSRAIPMRAISRSSRATLSVSARATNVREQRCRYEVRA